MGNDKKVPDTIGKERGEQLRRQGARTNWFSRQAVDRRKASEQQRKKSRWS